jgi:hypothetical protein
MTLTHALAKLRMHSESMITFLEATFKKFSHKLHKFRDLTCATFDTIELPREKVAHQCRAAQCSENGNTSQESSGARVKKFNLLTYKFHTMGDYTWTIRLFGTTYSFTTQIVCMLCLPAVYLMLGLDRGNLLTEPLRHSTH